MGNAPVSRRAEPFVQLAIDFGSQWIPAENFAATCHVTCADATKGTQLAGDRLPEGRHLLTA
jgi:hypothetical protein